jgi:hypothetical protein
MLVFDSYKRGLLGVFRTLTILNSIYYFRVKTISYIILLYHNLRAYISINCQDINSFLQIE